MIELILSELKNAEQHLKANPIGLQSLESEIEKLAESEMVSNQAFLLFRNEFRVRHAKHMNIRRPRLLVGMTNYTLYPNFQTVSLLRFGDLVSLACQSCGEERDDRLIFDVETEDLSEAISRLPDGFIPELFYWETLI